MQAICFDTSDDLLAAHGVSIRLRKEGRHWIQTAKAITPHRCLRLEHNVHVTPIQGRGEPALNLSLYAAEPVGQTLLHLLGRGPLGLSTASKADLGSRLARGQASGFPVCAGIADTMPEADDSAFLVATMASCLKQVLGNASAIGAGTVGEEWVHQLRIGLRHLRTVLRELRAERYGADPTWAPVLRRVFEELGVHRDRSVVMLVRAELAEAGCPPLVDVARAAALRSLAHVVRDLPFQQTLLDMLVFLNRTVKRRDASSRPHHNLRSFVANRLARLHRLLADDVDRFTDLAPARQHRVRKRLGRLICLGEAAESLFGRKRVERYLGGWREAERWLGKSNDLRTANEALTAASLPGPALDFAACWFAERRRESARHCRQALRKAMKKPGFW